jgi:hypothetical protein
MAGAVKSAVDDPHIGAGLLTTTFGAGFALTITAIGLDEQLVDEFVPTI